MELPRFSVPRWEPYSASVICLWALECSVFAFLWSTTFAVAWRAVPDGEDHFPGQAKVVHSRPQQHIPTCLLAFRSERFPLLFNQREHLTIRGMAGGCQSP